MAHEATLDASKPSKSTASIGGDVEVQAARWRSATKAALLRIVTRGSVERVVGGMDGLALQSSAQVQIAKRRSAV